jgi:hypothetical protein
MVGFDPTGRDNFSSTIKPIQPIRWQSGTIPPKRWFAYHVVPAKRFT